MAKKVALLIGVSEYGEGIPSLSAPLNDVAAMKQVLENPEMGGFDEVETLPNPDPTAMRIAIQQIFANCRKDDLVLLFFSGHGITDDNNRLYLATKGTSKDLYKATSVPARFVHDVSLESYAKRQAIILDCCYSGAFAEGWQAKSVGLDLKKELGGEGRVVLTSSTATQTSFQQEGEDLSLYTKYFVEGIETGAADQDEDGKIYARDLHEYAKTKVRKEKPKQKPGIITDKEGFNIILSQALVNDPELDFRKLVEQYATEGSVTTVGKNLLQLKQQELGITQERSDEIVNEVLAPYRKRLENIELFKQAFIEAVDQNYPLSEGLINELKALEDVLGLEDKDIAEIQKQILAKKEAEWQLQQQEQEEYQNKLQQYEQELLKAVEQEYPLSKHTQNLINSCQQSLGLRDEDIALIKQPIIDQQETKYQEKLTSSQFSASNISSPSPTVAKSFKKLRWLAGLTFILTTLMGIGVYLILDKNGLTPLLESLETQYEQGNYQGCYQLAVDNLDLDHSMINEWSGKCGLEAAKIKAKANSYSEAIAIAQKIPNTVSNYQEVKNSINSWSQIKREQQAIDQQFTSKETGVNYTQLRDLLAAGKWQEADRETTWMMSRAAGGKKGESLRTEDLNKFPCEDLRIMDGLWLSYSQDKFGFSVQNKIWNSNERPSPNSSTEVWNKLYIALGWTTKESKYAISLVNYNDLMGFKDKEKAREGNLPFWRWNWELYFENELEEELAPKWGYTVGSSKLESLWKGYYFLLRVDYCLDPKF